MSESDCNRAKKLIDEINEVISTHQPDYNIFVLGSGPYSHYNIARTKIRDNLRENGFPNTFFPEDITTTIGVGGEVDMEDYLIYEKADLIINLPTSEGSSVEAGLYSKEKKTRSKLIVFIEEQFAEHLKVSWRTGNTSSYLGGWLSKLPVENIATYSKEDLDKCEACNESEIIKLVIKIAKREVLKDNIKLA